MINANRGLKKLKSSIYPYENRYVGAHTFCHHKIGAFYTIEVEYVASNYVGQREVFHRDSSIFPGVWSIGFLSEDYTCFIFNWSLFDKIDKSRLSFVKVLIQRQSGPKILNVNQSHIVRHFFG